MVPTLPAISPYGPTPADASPLTPCIPASPEALALAPNPPTACPVNLTFPYLFSGFVTSAPTWAVACAEASPFAPYQPADPSALAPALVPAWNFPLALPCPPPHL